MKGMSHHTARSTSTTWFCSQKVSYLDLAGLASATRQSLPSTMGLPFRTLIYAPGLGREPLARMWGVVWGMLVHSARTRKAVQNVQD